MCILYPAIGLFKEILNKATHWLKGAVSTSFEKGGKVKYHITYNDPAVAWITIMSGCEYEVLSHTEMLI